MTPHWQATAAILCEQYCKLGAANWGRFGNKKVCEHVGKADGVKIQIAYQQSARTASGTSNQHTHITSWQASFAGPVGYTPQRALVSSSVPHRFHSHLPLCIRSSGAALTEMAVIAAVGKLPVKSPPAHCSMCSYVASDL